jgi:glycogen(starch) synthase
MKIVLATHAFYPSIGGLETVARILAKEFCRRGHEVRIIAQTPAPGRTPAEDEAEFGCPVFRRPGVLQMLLLVKWCDIYFQNNISLRSLWPVVLMRRRWVVSHQTWLTRVDGEVGWQDRLKKFAIRFGSPIAISRAVAEPLPVKATLIGNPYQDQLFRKLPDVVRDRDIVFLARLVSDKGGDVTLGVMAELKKNGLTPSLTIVGDGPERQALERMTAKFGLEDQVTFTGIQTGETLVRTLNRHRIMVVPSRLAEPFGVVALEGIACGCALVGSERGGLADAIGPCGLTFPNGDVAAMAAAVRRLLEDYELCRSLRAHAEQHLLKHSPAQIAAAYLEVFEQVLQ